VSLPPALAASVRDATGRGARAGERVSGGSINEAWRVELDDGTPAFVKTRAGAAPEEYATEAAGLRWLAAAGGLPVPAVLGLGTEVLVLEWVPEGARGDAAALGRGLAAVHAAGAPAFGAAAPPRDAAAGDRAAPPGGAAPPRDTPPPAGPLRIGPIVLPNDPLPDWPAFYAERRLRPLLAPAAHRGALAPAGVKAIERVCERLPELAGPAEPPARLHGDLWSGNVYWGADGRPWLIDPAAYGGHREVDLAMLHLFGDPGPAFLPAYEERAPLADGHAGRAGLWQLFPLLVHAVLFGGGYGASAERTARTYL
jgi:fructosamine-3-kinase